MGDEILFSGENIPRFTRKNLGLIAVTLGSLLIISPIAAITLMDGIPPRGSTDVCNGCHGGVYDLVIEDPTLTIPSTIEVGENDQATVSVRITSDGTNSYWEFDIIIKLISLYSKVSVSSQQVFNNQRPSGSSQPYTWTKDVVFDLNGITPGTDTLRAEARMDADHFSAPTTRSVTDTLTVPNTPPTLTGGAVDPLFGNTETDLTFSVTYMDPDVQAPSSIDVHVAGGTYPLSVTDGNADSIGTGEGYSATIKLPAGEHSFHFEASDGIDQTSFPVSGGDIEGPNIIIKNTPPVLSDQEVSPASGNCNDTFRFSVTYTDEEGDVPQAVNLTLNGTIIPMTALTGGMTHLSDGDHSNGERYVIELFLECGVYHYSFNTTDGELYHQIGSFSGPFVSEVPILISRILEPGVGGAFLFNSTIRFNSSFDSNQDITDATFKWSSNISGTIGGEQNIEVILPPGRHRISLEVNSIEWGLVSFDHVNITVDEEVVMPPDPVFILGHSPEGNRSVVEGDTITFSINLDMDQMIHTMEWTINGVVIDEGTTSLTFEPTYLDQGSKIIEFVLFDENGDELGSVMWNVTVIDRKAPILLTGDIIEDRGEFEKGDMLFILLPVTDPEGRELTVTWHIDGDEISASGIELYWELKAGPWSKDGNHSVNATIENPDGNSISIDFFYRMLVEEEIIIPQDEDPIIIYPEEDTDKGLFASIKDDAGARAILALGTIALVFGVIWSVFVLIRPIKSRGPKMEE